MRKAHECRVSSNTFPLAAGHASDPPAIATKTTEASNHFISCYVLHWPYQAPCCKPSLTRPLFRNKAQLKVWGTPWTRFLPQGTSTWSLFPSAQRLWLCTYPHTTQIWLVTGQDKGKSFCWAHFSMSAFVLPWHHISKMLWCVMILTQPQASQTDRWKASFPFWQSSQHTDTHKQFWFGGKGPL